MLNGITDQCSGATTFGQVWKPVNAVGAASDAYAPFALGQTNKAVVNGAPVLAQFCRVSGNIGIAGTAGITNGVTVASAGGNTWQNNTGVALVAGDYAFLTAATVKTP